MSDVRELSPAERRRLPDLAAGADLAVDDLAPYGWDLAGSRWWEAPDLQAAIIAGDPPTFCFDRGASFDNDWVRELWIVAPRGRFRSSLAALSEHLLARRARVLRWRVEAPLSRAAERYWEGCGAAIVGAVGEGDFFVMQRVEQPATYVRTPSGYSVGRVRPSEVDRLAQWCQDPHVHQPLGFDEPPTGHGIRRFLYPPDPSDRDFVDLLILTARWRGQPIGFCIEHGWEFPGDPVREITLTLAGLERPSPRAIRELTPGLMDGCYRRGAVQTLVNMRAGESGRGFPRLFAWVGAGDVTDRVRAYGGGQEGRRYYAATRESFYGSRGGGPLATGPSR